MIKKTIVLLAVMIASLLIPHVIVDAGTEKNDVPIIFIHGYNSGEGAWKSTEFSDRMKARLSENNIYYVNYSKNSRNDITSTTVQKAFEETFTEAIKKDGHAQVDVVAHSMGGLGVRWFLKNNPEYVDNIRHIQFIATPHNGANIAFINRLASILQEPEFYYDLQGQTVEQYLASYTKLYGEYVDEEMFNSTSKPQSFEDWL